MMKRRELMKDLKRIAKERGEEFTTKEGGNHTKVWVGKAYTTVPRHSEINELTTKHIYKQIGE